MYDTFEQIGKSLIQHGKSNDRIYLMKLDKHDMFKILPQIRDLAKKNNYSKIFAKVPLWGTYYFEKYQYHKEAFIPKMVNGCTGIYFMSKFLKKSRYTLSRENWNKIHDILHMAKLKGKTFKSNNSECPYLIRQLTQNDISQLTTLYKKVFNSYPFPIFEDEYILKTMEENIFYFGVFENEKLIAASSAETDMQHQNVEMTDFATHPDYLGNNLSFFLLNRMEEEMEKLGFIITYTIARSISPAMNITFAKNKYKFGGLLKNNTNIGGHIESMNVWYKNLKSNIPV
ncbi:putative beta-lysine N-acetyltransferase [candidate division KSB1 bacterium]|nr:putative beta-lysine N-acetyltransferase [candidate division KSB1 bacterium]